MIFDGKLKVLSTCRDCGEVMVVFDVGEYGHPTCDAKPTEVEQLTAQLATAVLNDESLTIQKSLERELEKLDQLIDLDGAAMNYADWGWPVFPLARNGKQPAIPKAKGGQGFKQATNDVKRIGKWWKRHPDHNIGLATGHAFDVIDVDTKDSDGNPSYVGVQSFMNMLENDEFRKKQDGERINCHGIAITASGGMHLYVKPTGKGNFQGIRAGIDYRGLGGYVVAPPSTLGERWRSYAWLIEPSPVIKGEK